MAYNHTQENARRRRQASGERLPRRPKPDLDRFTIEEAYAPPSLIALMSRRGGTFQHCVFCGARRRTGRSVRRHAVREHMR
jgi:hypothetical protein